MQHSSGVITVSIFAMLLAALVGGGVVGLVLGSLASPIVLAFICALVGAVLALLIGRTILGRNAQIAVPSGVIIWNLVIALWLGALAGHELSVDLRDPPAAPLIGALSGVLAAVSIISFVITIHTLRSELLPPNARA